MVDSIESSINTVLGDKFRIVKKVGEGGMGTVYLGEHMQIGKKVAIKMLRQHHTGDETKVRRFYREARVAAAVGHRNIIDVYDVGVSPKGFPYMVMEYLEGESLASLLERKGPFDVGITCAILSPVADALSVAHDKGIVHRDLKPDNIFLVPMRGNPPEVKIIDFGVSKFIEMALDRLTMPGYVVGTPAYMSPEQADGKAEIDYRADVFSLGIIVYEMLTGYLPFEGDTNNRVMYNLLYRDPVPPRMSNPKLPVAIDAVMLKVLAKSKEDRYQSVREFIDELKKAASSDVGLDQLSALSDEILSTGIAGGDIGVSRDAKRRPIQGSELTQAVDTSTISRSQQTSVKKRVQRKLLIYGALSLLVLVGLIIGTVLVTSSIRDDSADVWSAKHGEIDVRFGQVISIQVEGLPEGAKIYHGEELMVGNPFSVPRQFNMLSFRVTVDGYKTEQFAIVPSEDRHVKLSFVKEPE